MKLEIIFNKSSLRTLSQIILCSFILFINCSSDNSDDEIADEIVTEEGIQDQESEVVEQEVGAEEETNTSDEFKLQETTQEPEYGETTENTGAEDWASTPTEEAMPTEEMQPNAMPTEEMPSEAIATDRSLDEPQLPEEVATIPETTSEVASTTSTETVSEGDKIYLVEPKDTLGTIANKIYGDKGKWKFLAEHNSLENPHMIFPGQEIRYTESSYSQEFTNAYENIARKSIKVNKGDTLSKIAEQLTGNASYWKTIWKLNADNIQNPNLIYEDQVITYIDSNVLTDHLSKRGDTMPAH